VRRRSSRRAVNVVLSTHFTLGRHLAAVLGDDVRFGGVRSREHIVNPRDTVPSRGLGIQPNAALFVPCHCRAKHGMQALCLPKRISFRKSLKPVTVPSVLPKPPAHSSHCDDARTSQNTTRRVRRFPPTSRPSHSLHPLSLDLGRLDTHKRPQVLRFLAAPRSLGKPLWCPTGEIVFFCVRLERLCVGAH